jgi:hypothetical protein
MEIRKFAGNTYEILKDLEPEQRIKDLQDSKNMKNMFDHKIPPAKLKILGLLWDFVCDLLGFDFDAVERAVSPMTKMKMLVLLHTLYDPLGILM